MKIGIIGLANSGKTTVFNALTGLEMETAGYSSMAGEPNVGTVKVPDERVDRLAEMYNPRKITYATVEYVDYLGIAQGDPAQNRKVADLIKDVDAVVHVVRGFEDETVPHPLVSVDPVRDAGTVELELILSDLELVEKRLERIEEGEKRGRKADQGERGLLLRCREELEGEVALRRVDFSEQDRLAMRHLQFLSVKPELVLLNEGEGDPGTERESSLLQRLEGSCNLPVLALPGKIEMEISQLSPEEAELFLRDLGIGASAMARVIGFCYEHLGLISFLTVGEDEVRAWTVHRGTAAQRAAGKIHSDIERGFIRAEVVACDDLLREGSMGKAREKGLVRLEGKTYAVQDGDVINFRFNV